MFFLSVFEIVKPEAVSFINPNASFALLRWRVWQQHALADSPSWQEHAPTPAPVGKRMLLPPILVSKSMLLPPALVGKSKLFIIKRID